MNVDDIHLIADCSRATLRELIGRVEQSRSFEQMVYRESELDEIWRLLDNDIAAAARQRSNERAVRRLAALRALIVEAHDFIGNDSNTIDARDRLLKAVELV